jgi:hypothetical protein
LWFPRQPLCPCGERDFNGDGIDDLIAFAQQGTGAVIIQQGQTDGTFGTAGLYLVGFAP